MPPGADNRIDGDETCTGSGGDEGSRKDGDGDEGPGVAAGEVGEESNPLPISEFACGETVLASLLSSFPPKGDPSLPSSLPNVEENNPFQSPITAADERNTLPL